MAEQFEEKSASLLEQLLRAVQALKSPEAALAWACQAIGAKNSLTNADAQLLDDAFRTKLADLEIPGMSEAAVSPRMRGNGTCAVECHRALKFNSD